jgi:hypothetical protein
MIDDDKSSGMKVMLQLATLAIGTRKSECK